MTTKQWRDVPGFEGHYQVSQFGEVKSLQRVIMRSNGFPQTVSERVLRQNTNPRGYKTVILQRETHPVHRLVTSAFIGKRPNKHDVNHIDGNKANNSVSNLQYVTRSENIRHAIRTGLNKMPALRGEKCPWSKLTEKNVRTIKKRVASGEMLKTLSIEFGVSYRTIRAIKAGEIWKSIEN